MATLRYRSPEYRKIAASRRRKQYKENPDLFADYAIRSHYKITLADYDRMYAEQNGSCAICSVNKPSRGKGRLHIDHDHQTGKVRGLLCTQCNVGIGMLKTAPEILETARNYLLTAAVTEGVV